jgi:5-(carboxyamino)imidazole ribonucleotide synthase
MAPVLPGATIGFFGGGQLGRMTGYAARSMGYDLRVLDPDPAPPAAVVASTAIAAAFDDAEAADRLARGCAVVTAEIEKIGPAALAAALRHAPVRPSPEVLRMVQDRGRQKRWLADRGFPLGGWAHADSAAAVERAARETGAPAVLKLCHGGYDGRGQARIADAAGARAAWETLGAAPVVVERFLDLEAELSVLVARRPSGEMVVYPPSRNHHEHGVLAWSVVPSGLPGEALREAERIARGIAEEARLEGLLCIELFLVRDGRVLVNELAPRPHNSYHHSERACVTGQFEQLVRAVCDLPLGAPDVAVPGAIMNLLGDLWSPAPPDFARALEVDGVRLHLYGKASARPGRKMGHLSSVAATPEEALRRVQQAYARLASR